MISRPRIFFLWLFLTGFLPVTIHAKGNPRTEVNIQGERQKKTPFGMVTLKGTAWLYGKKYPEVTEEIWQNSVLERGTLAKEFVIHGLTFPAGSEVGLIPRHPYHLEFRVKPSSDLSLGGLVFSKGASHAIHFKDTLNPDGNYYVSHSTKMVIYGTLKELATINGLPIAAGNISCWSLHRDFRAQNPHGVQLIDGKIAKPTTIYQDIKLLPGDKVSYDQNYIPSRLGNANCLGISYEGDRTVRGYPNVRFYNLNYRTGHTAKLYFSKPTKVNGLMAESVEFYADGSIHEILPDRYRTKWNGIPLNGPISYWPNGKVQQAHIASHKVNYYLFDSGPKYNRAYRDTHNLQGLPLDTVEILRLAPDGRLAYAKTYDGKFRVRDGKLTPLPEKDPLGGWSKSFGWITALQQE